MGMSEKELVLKYREACDECDRFAKLLAAASAIKMGLESSLEELMDADDKTTTAEYEGVGKVVAANPQLYASVLAENREKLYDFLRGEDREDMIKTSVAGGSLSSLVKQMIQDGKELPAFITYYIKTGVRLKRS